MNSQFIYSILQYKHSLALGEALNIGVLFSFPEENKVQFVAGSTQRVKCVYPNFDTTIFTRISKNIKTKISDDNRLYSYDLLSQNKYSFKDYINKEILPEDSTSLQFTEPLTALNDTGNYKIAIEEFSKILLPITEDKFEEKRHNESYIIRSYQDKLIHKTNSVKYQNRLRTNYEIKSNKVSLNFEIAWKNETLLHCVKPISFDLREAAHIQDKSVRFFGYFSLLNQYARQNNLWFDILVASPQQPGLDSAYLKALDLLQDTKAPQRIVTEENLEEYSDETAVNINKELL